MGFLIDLSYYAWVVFLLATGVRYVATHRNGFYWYRRLDLRLYGYVFLALALVVSGWLALDALEPTVFGFSWLTAVAALFGREGSSANVNLAGMEIPVLGMVLCGLLAPQLHGLARGEERMFRGHTRNWLDALPRSLAFGLIHMVVGVPLGAALAMSLAGLVFTHAYFRGGLRLSTQVHFQYNALVVGLLFVWSAANTAGVIVGVVGRLWG